MTVCSSETLKQEMNTRNYMNHNICIKYVDHREAVVAGRLHAVQMLAYRQEAELLGVKDFPPLTVSVSDIQELPEKFLAAFAGDEIIGAISIEPDEEAGAHSISSLVVHPCWQRQGVAGRLMAAVTAEYGSAPMTVQTAEKNLPALALYAKYGFVEFKRWCVGDEKLELVRLRRLSAFHIPS